MANCYFAEAHGMKHCYIPFFMFIDFKRALSFGEGQVLRYETSARARRVLFYCCLNCWPKRIHVSMWLVGPGRGRIADSSGSCRVAVRMVQQFPQMRLDTQRPDRAPNFGFRGLKA